jgi:hypothetical protein
MGYRGWRKQLLVCALRGVSFQDLQSSRVVLSFLYVCSEIQGNAIKSQTHRFCAS